MYKDDKLPIPVFIDNSSSSNLDVVYSSANFFRTSTNNNIEITAPLGVEEFVPERIWTSGGEFLPTNTYNSTASSAEISFLSNRDISINNNINVLHDIMIYYKLVKPDGEFYINNREIRINIVKGDGTTEYDPSIYSNTQPLSGEHSYVMIKGYISHVVGDVIKLKFNIIQDDVNADQSSSKIVIFRISWTMTGTRI